MTTPHDFWQSKHQKYLLEPWIAEPTYFATEVVERFPARARVLDLGCGQGQDSAFFAHRSFTVTAVDFAEFALSNFPEFPAGRIEQIQHSLDDFPYPFENGAFDVVYAHLSLHYFDAPATAGIFEEIHRILRPEGLLAVMVNSVDDPEYGEGERLGDDFFEVSPGDRKRYFSRAGLYGCTKELFIPYLLEQSGRTRKDPHRAFVRLVASRKVGAS